MLGRDSNEIDVTALTELPVETDAAFETLADSRRRFVLVCLEEYATPMALSDVVDELATREHEASIAEVPPREVQSIYLSLYHKHIPQMVDTGVVEYSQERDAVVLTESGSELTSTVDLPAVNE